MNLSSSKKVKFEPPVFDGSDDVDLKSWLRRFELYGRLNKWDEEDNVDFLELFMEGKSLMWYQNNQDKFETWEITKSLMENEFDGKDGEMRAWSSLQTLKFSNFNNIDEFEIQIDKLLTKAKVTEERSKIKFFISALNSEHQKLVIKAKVNTLKKAMNVIREETELEEMVKPKSELKKMSKDRVITKVHEQNNNGDIKTLIEGMERMNLNILEKLSHLKPYNYTKKEYNTDKTDSVKRGECFYCKEQGHRKWECPKLKLQNKVELNCLEMEKEYNLAKDLLAFEKRTRDDESNNVNISTKNKIRRVEGNVKHDISQADELAKPKIRIRKNQDIKLSEHTEKYSIKQELSEIMPKINLAQLLRESPSIRKELTELFKKIEYRELNYLGAKTKKVTNCKALMEIFENHYTTIVDTEAACSIITSKLLDKLGLIADTTSSHVIITADGTRHVTTGKVTAVPIKIAGYTFGADLLVMNESSNDLVLGTDWLLKHKAVVDLNNSEMLLPVDDLEVIISLTTNVVETNLEDQDIEYYGIAKEELMVASKSIDSNGSTPKELKQLMFQYKEIFVEDIMDLKQTDVIEHSIDTGSSNA
ncbi:hypothetical protein BB561_003906 [Smittium simulii]|uniref:CCHC-type domain-containing protein n=1 Tax=Smittium simulii TaxID=133385 RepID=A0A2T9YJ04_9FUNG|nr:hypothetical protein BB561_003906 [Smittium simulii]